MESITFGPTDDEKWLVYQATNLVTGERYIGSTGQPLVVRAWQHLHQHITSDLNRPGGRRRVFHKAIATCGHKNFRFDVLKKFASRGEALQHEASLIRDLEPEYNTHLRGTKRTDATKRTLRAAARRRCKSAPIVCTNDGELFASTSEAARHYGLNGQGVGRALRGLNVPVNRGFQFKHTQAEWSA